MRTVTRWIHRAGLAAFAGAMLLPAALLRAQEREGPPPPVDRQQAQEEEIQPSQGRDRPAETTPPGQQDRQPGAADGRERDAPRTFRQPEDQQAGRSRSEGRDQGDGGRAWLGVLLSPDERGVRVVQVFPGSPADRAGLRMGDLLVGSGGQEFHAPEDVSQAIADEQPGSTAPFTIERQGREERVEVELGRRPRGAQRGMPGFPGAPDMEGMMREFRGFGPDREMIEEHRRIQQEHQQLKQQVSELQQQLREMRRELDQLRQQRQGGAGENAPQNP
jgi:hypothetical protein